jgi:hypothetical protein
MSEKVIICLAQFVILGGTLGTCVWLWWKILRVMEVK